MINMSNKVGGFLLAAFLISITSNVVTYNRASTAKTSAATWESLAATADVELTVARGRIKELNDELDTERATSANLRMMLDEQQEACARDGKRLSAMDDELERAGFESVSAILTHLTLHERQASDLARWWKGRKLDLAACMCELGGRANCDPTKVYGEGL